MAANYWASTQYRHWQCSSATLQALRQELEEREKHLIQQYPLPEWRHLSLFFNQHLTKLGKKFSVRQQALATAQVYLRRFYTKVEIRRTNPYLVMATALYLACKMEECPHHIRHIVHEARQLWSGLLGGLDVAKLGECEFLMISELDSQLIIHHPYRTLQDLQSTLNMGQDDVSLAWSVINDNYLTDLCLLHPPHVIAVTAIFLAFTLKPGPVGLQAAANTASTLSSPAVLVNQVDDNASTGTPAVSVQQNKVQKLISWLAESEIDLKAIITCSQEIISLYEVLDHFNESACKEQIARYVRARNLDK